MTEVQCIAAPDQVSDTGSTGYLVSQPVVVYGDMELGLDKLLGPGFADLADKLSLHG